MEKEKNRFNVEEHTTLDNKIIDVFPISHRYIHNLETQLKKQKEIIEKIQKEVDKIFKEYQSINRAMLLTMFEKIYQLLQILEDKEV